MPGVFLRLGNRGSTGGFSLAMTVCVLRALFFVSSQFVNVNLEIFAKVKFSRTCEMRNALSLTDMSKSYPNCNFLHRKYVF